MINQQTLVAAAETVVERSLELARHSENDLGCTRTFCSAAMKSAHRQLAQWMQEIGLDCQLDAVGNLIGRTRPVADDQHVFLIGSHLDTVINAGPYDGMLGILLGLAVVDVLSQSKVQLPFGIHVIAFSEEEGVRYRFPFIGSRGITDSLNSEDFLRTDQAGIAMRDALQEFGCPAVPLASPSYVGKPCLGFLEPHIEQAVELEASNLPVGVVTAVAGQTRAAIIVEGIAGHAGTTPPLRRRDALAAAAELIVRIEGLGQRIPGLYATVGRLVASPGLSNVISGHAELSLDLRHEQDLIREQAFHEIKTMIKELSDSRNVGMRFASVEHTPAVPMDRTLNRCLIGAISDTGFACKPLVSGAGHDAMIMAKMVPSCMLFVRCRGGISHHPDEFVSLDDIRVALEVMAKALIKIGQQVLTSAD